MSFYEKYLSLNLNDYPAIGIDLEINKLILIIFIALAISTVFLNYHRLTVYTVIKQLTRHGAFGEGCAASLDVLRLSEKRYGKTIKNSSRISHIVGITSENEGTGCEKYYIKEDMRDSAEHIVGVGAPTVLNTVLFALLLLAVCVCLIFVMPSILTLINNILSK